MRVPWNTVTIACWLTATLALLTRLALRFALGLRLLRVGHPLESERLRRAVDGARSRLGVVQPVGIRCSERVHSPVIWCWGREPVLLMQKAASDGPKRDGLGGRLLSRVGPLATAGPPERPVRRAARGRASLASALVVGPEPAAEAQRAGVRRLGPGHRAKWRRLRGNITGPRCREADGVFTDCNWKGKDHARENSQDHSGQRQQPETRDGLGAGGGRVGPVHDRRGGRRPTPPRRFRADGAPAAKGVQGATRGGGAERVGNRPTTHRDETRARTTHAASG